MSQKELSAKHRLFAETYVTEACNGTAAYKKVYRTENDTTAKASANKLLKRHDIEAYIQDLQAKIIKKVEITRDQIIAEFAKIGFANITDYAEFDNGKLELSNSKDITIEKLAAISEVINTTGKTGSCVKIKLHSKIDALNSLAKILGYNSPEKLDLGIDFEGLSDSQLDLIIKKLSKTVEND